MTLGEVADAMNLLPEVRWDRCVRREDGGGVAYGWIGRDDGRADFVLLSFGPGGVGFTTSSAKYSRDISTRLFGSCEGHRDCERVEDVFGTLVANRVSLREGEAA